VCILQSFSASIDISSTNTVSSVTVSAGALPDGLDLVFTPGSPFIILTGTPTVGGNFAFTLMATDGSGNQMSKAYNLCIIDIHPATMPAGGLCQSYFVQLSATCGTATAWEVFAGSLPDGLTLDGVTGAISGIPGTLGDFPFTIAGTVESVSCSKDFSIHVGDTTNISALPDGHISQKYSYQLTATWGVGPYTWVVVGSGFPSGLTLSSSGLISGIPISQLGFAFTLRATDSTGKTCSMLATMDVLGPCGPNWNNLLWGTPVLTQVNNGTASFSPSNTAQASLSMSADCPLDTTDTGAATNSSSFLYTGPATNCFMDVVMVKTPVGSGRIDSIIRVFWDGGQVGSANNTGGTISFAIPLSVNKLISVTASVACPNQGGINHTLNVVTTGVAYNAPCPT
jgi:hypothetical protein